MKFKSKLSSARIGGNESDKQISKIKNIRNFIACKRRLLNFILINFYFYSD